MQLNTTKIAQSLIECSGDELLSTVVTLFDPGVEEVFLDGIGQCSQLRDGALCEVAFPFPSVEIYYAMCLATCINKTGLPTPEVPVAGGVWKDHRWHLVFPPMATDGPLLSVRRMQLGTRCWQDFALDTRGCSQVEAWIDRKIPIVVTGSTGSGKSSLLQLIIDSFLCRHRVAMIESFEELRRSSPLWFHLLGDALQDGDGLRRCFVEVLRLRPEFVVVGELRGKEVETWLDVVSSGVAGSLTTMHAGADLELRFQRMMAKRSSPYSGPIGVIALENRKVKELKEQSLFLAE